MQIFVHMRGVVAPVVSLAAGAQGNGSDGEGGTESVMHRSAAIITSPAQCARRGAEEIWGAYFFRLSSFAMKAAGPPSR